VFQIWKIIVLSFPFSIFNKNARKPNLLSIPGFWILYLQFGSIPPQKTTLQKKLDIHRALEYYIKSKLSCLETMNINASGQLPKRKSVTLLISDKFRKDKKT